MKELNDNLVMQRLGAYVIKEIQKSLGIARTMRLDIDADNHVYWERSGDGMKFRVNGASQQRRTEAQIEITYFYDRDLASIWVDDITTLVSDRRYDSQFDPEKDLPDAPIGSFERDVSLVDANELLEIWENVPPNPKETVMNRMPNIVGKT